MLKILVIIFFSVFIEPPIAGAEPYGNCDRAELNLRKLDNVVPLVCEKVQGIHPSHPEVTVLIERFPVDQYDLSTGVTVRVFFERRRNYGLSDFGRTLRPFLFDGRRVEYAIKDITGDQRPEIIFTTLDYSGIEFLVVLTIRQDAAGRVNLQPLRPFVEAEGRRVPEDAEDTTYVIKDGVNSAHVKSDGTIEIVRFRDPVNPNSQLERRLYRFNNGEFVRQSVTPLPRASR